MAKPGSPLLGSAALQYTPTTKVNVTEQTCLNLSLFKNMMRDYRRLDDTIVMRLNRNGALFRDPAQTSTSSKQPTSGGDDEACLYFWRQLIANWKARAEIIDYCVKVADSRIEEKEQALNAILNTPPVPPVSSQTPPFQQSTSVYTGSTSEAYAGSTSRGLFSPHSKADGSDGWKGARDDFYRPPYARDQTTFTIGGKSYPLSLNTPIPPVPPNASETQTQATKGQTEQRVMTDAERRDYERRQRDLEKDARAAFWEERVKRDQITNEKTVEAIVRRRSYEAFKSRCEFFEPPSALASKGSNTEVFDAEARRWWEDAANSR